MKYDITIFGSGISAKITSVELAKKRLNVCLISDFNNNEIKQDSNLVTFLSRGSTNYLSTIISNFQFLDQYTDIKKIKCKIHNFDETDNQSISFDSSDDKTLGKIVSNSSLEHCLDEEIKKIGNLETIYFNSISKVKNTSTGVKITLNNGEMLSSKLLIISSTKDKKLLEQTKIKFITKDFRQKAFSFNLKCNIIDKE